MKYDQFNREEILEKAKERYSKEKASEYYLKNKEAIKEKATKCYKNITRRKRQDWRAPKKEISRIGSV